MASEDDLSTPREIAEDREFKVPQRAVRSPEDMATWEKSGAYKMYLQFILDMNNTVKGRSCIAAYQQNPISDAILTILNTLLEWIDQIPPIQQPQRFGNKAFKIWFEKLRKESHEMFLNLFPDKFHVAIAEIHVYFAESFGNPTRIDYGTGHEMAFCMFLCCMFNINALTEREKLAGGLIIFTKYLDVVRKLQTVYKMEPAGSRGVWALDDFQFVPFIWGSAQLIGNPHIEPSDFLKEDIIMRYSEHYMFLKCIKYINENKTGLFAEHSNQLWNISGVLSWEKVNAGLIKMYKAEVLAKFPVIQHVLFGSILSIEVASPYNPRPYHRMMEHRPLPLKQSVVSLKDAKEPDLPVEEGEHESEHGSEGAIEEEEVHQGNSLTD
ncbi:serine/threonine-protein phosphatase 2A activator-like [Cimex lectularius]|uniref:Serine/threonine-protein phosphatase 2A activator n=1 Tax=Cimex lectularius TaxID=79782 RepID=A0A8I6S8W6_CIMLE|nr:serine/threonine-protein phosphatase 2A activator-like [Cimex lectularius]